MQQAGHLRIRLAVSKVPRLSTVARGRAAAARPPSSAEEPLHPRDDRTPRAAEGAHDSPVLLQRLHRALAGWNARRLRPEAPSRRWREDLEEDLRLRTLEGEWIETERAAVGPLVRGAPRSSQRFVRWFEALRPGGSDALDPLLDWLAEHSTLDDLRWLVRQELAADPGFEDLLALTRLGMPPRPKEAMGHGRREGTHAGRVQRQGRALGVESDGPRALWEALALSNLMVGLAVNRRYAWQAVGALAAVELTTPDLAGSIDRALERLGIAGKAPSPLEAPASVDRERSSGWSSAVLAPLVEEDPDRAPLLAEGAVLRLRAGRRALCRYRSELGVPP